jgi:hypothetical protein
MGISNFGGCLYSRRICNFTILAIATRRQFLGAAIWEQNEGVPHLVEMVDGVALLALPLADVTFLRLGRATPTVETTESFLEKGRHRIIKKGEGVTRDLAALLRSL